MKKYDKTHMIQVAKMVLEREEHPCPHCSQASGHHPDCVVTKAREFLEKEKQVA